MKLVCVALSLSLSMSLLGCGKAEPESDATKAPGSIDLPAPNSALVTKVTPVTMENGTQCIIVQNGYRGVGIDCNFPKPVGNTSK